MPSAYVLYRHPLVSDSQSCIFSSDLPSRFQIHLSSCLYDVFPRLPKTPLKPHCGLYITSSQSQ